MVDGLHFLTDFDDFQSWLIDSLTRVIITREYTISLLQNANVLPFRYYGMVVADTISGYKPIAAQFVGRSTTTNGVVQATDSARTFHVYTYNSWAISDGVKLRVIYLKNS